MLDPELPAPLADTSLADLCEKVARLENAVRGLLDVCDGLAANDELTQKVYQLLERRIARLESIARGETQTPA